MMIDPINQEDELLFRQMVVEYWRDVVPSSFFLGDPVQAEAMYQMRYHWTGISNRPYWAMDDGHPVGFFMTRLYDDGTSAYIHDFFIQKPFRRQGYGTALFLRIKEWLSEMGVIQIELSVQADNPDAHEFWKNMGFRDLYCRMERPVRSMGNRADAAGDTER